MINDPLIKVGTRVLIQQDLSGILVGYGFIENSVKYLIELDNGNYLKQNTNCYISKLIVDPSTCEVEYDYYK